jgi:hypothetical protein
MGWVLAKALVNAAGIGSVNFENAHAPNSIAPPAWAGRPVLGHPEAGFTPPRGAHLSHAGNELHEL